ncbi:MAG: autotransporter outer membrane beta-barrel domain-containing protein [Pseudomonadota bacterium]
MTCMALAASPSIALDVPTTQLGSSVILTQSIMGSIVNRPSSPFVTGLAFEDPGNPCGEGLWARGVGGQANGIGRVDAANSSDKVTLTAGYAGLQAGIDFGCYNRSFNDFDVAGGVIFGNNIGSTEQPIFGIDNTDPINPVSRRDSTTTIDFNQRYVGAYGTLARGGFAAEVQYRAEFTEFRADNTVIGGGTGVALDNERFSSFANTISGSVSNAFQLGQTNWAISPTAGASYTAQSTDTIQFSDGSTLRLLDSTTEVLFGGATLSRAVIGSDGTTRTSQFITATVYENLSDELISIFEEPGQPAEGVSSETLGRYGEISAGISFLKVYDEGLRPRQLNASLRGDFRIGERVDSWGLTGQIRWQY